MKLDEPRYQKWLQPLRPIATHVAPALENRSAISALMLDVYGTLLVSGAGEIGPASKGVAMHDEMDNLLERHGIQEQGRQIRERLQAAIRADHRRQRTLGLDWPEVDIVAIWKQLLGWDAKERIHRFALEFELLSNPVYPMPGADALLASCQRASVPVGIISNAQFYTPWLLQHFFGDDLQKKGIAPRLCFYSWREGAAKPSPMMFEKAGRALKEMEITTAAALYVGNDVRNDILPAARAGFTTALFAGDRRSLRLRRDDRSCREVSPDLIVTDLRQLIAFVRTAQRQQ